jgi:hypothetical protein
MMYGFIASSRPDDKLTEPIDARPFYGGNALQPVCARR